MTERPILFSTPLVGAILNGTKTVTRRLTRRGADGERRIYAEEGDVLWVRESWREGHDGYVYRAGRAISDSPHAGPWKPSIHMPRAACRLYLRVLSVDLEPLQAITEDDALREGVRGDLVAYGTDSAREAFRILWDKINGERCAWAENPLVWRVEFERMEGRP